MYQIDFMTCTADDVIARSAICHPSLFADTLREQGRTHIGAYAAMAQRDKYGANVAAGMASDCNTVADWIADERRSDLTFGQRVIAFAAAARLQCLSHAVAQDIVSRM
jgi:hypothetical protein